MADLGINPVCGCYSVLKDLIRSFHVLSDRQEVSSGQLTVVVLSSDHCLLNGPIAQLVRAHA